MRRPVNRRAIRQQDRRMGVVQAKAHPLLIRQPRHIIGPDNGMDRRKAHHRRLWAGLGEKRGTVAFGV